MRNQLGKRINEIISLVSCLISSIQIFLIKCCSSRVSLYPINPHIGELSQQFNIASFRAEPVYKVPPSSYIDLVLVPSHLWLALLLYVMLELC